MFPLLPLVAAAVLLGAEQAPPAPASPAPAPTQNLVQVFETPWPWLERELTVTFQVRTTPEHWNPYLTRFGTRDYVAAEVWGDRQLLWREADFSNPLGLVFAPRDSVAAAQLQEAATYDSFTARILVRQVFCGRPWAEILELTPQRRTVGEGTILHASRALTLMASEEWQMARDDLRRAASRLLPPHAEAELKQLIAICDAGLAERAARDERRELTRRSR